MTDKKPTKTELKRAMQKVALIDAGEKAIMREGLQGMRARDLADDIGVSLGSIYNLIDDLDELILLISSRTLEKLNKQLDDTLSAISEDQALERLIAAGLTYHHFARDNYYLWHSLFDYSKMGNKPLPEWVSQERLQPFKRITHPLSILMPHASDDEISVFSQALFASVHGMVIIGLDNRDVGIRSTTLDREIANLITIIAKGLNAPSS